MASSNDYSTTQATKWFVQLTSGNASDADYQQWRAWREADAANESAWQKVEQLAGQLKGYSSEKGLTGTLRRLYEQPPSTGRRNILKNMCVVMAVAATSYLGYQHQPWQQLLADYTTSTGEYREIALVDGTRLFLNTASAVKISFNEHQRVLTLLKGEVLIETGHEQGVLYRPFILKTSQGAVTALGTRFSVRQYGDYTSVSLFEGKLRIQPKHLHDPVLLNAGESLNFDANVTKDKGVADASAVAWSQGFIIVDQMTLGEFTTELARYRSGFLRCDPRIAHLRVSGAFPIDTNAAIHTLTRKFPVKTEGHTRFWLTLVPA